MNITRPLRPTLLSSSSSSTTLTAPLHHPPQCLHHKPQVRHATLIKRKKRPYTFTQLVTLSDGSQFTHRTTSPLPVLVSTKDSRNTLLWNPNNQRLSNVELDDAGKLQRFREKFGTEYDASKFGNEKKREKASAALEAEFKEAEMKEAERKAAEANAPESKEAEAKDAESSSQEPQSEGSSDQSDNLMDLISGFGLDAQKKAKGAGSKDSKDDNDKAGGGKK